MLKDTGARNILTLFISVCTGIFLFYAFLGFRFYTQSPRFFVSAAQAKAKHMELSPIFPVLSLTPKEHTKFSNIQNGRRIFVRYRCLLCHGVDGKGGIKNPNSQTGEEVPSLIYAEEGFTKEELRKKIQDGVSEIAKKDPKKQTPPLRMPAWKDIIKDDELDDLVDYLLSLMPTKTEDEEW